MAITREEQYLANMSGEDVNIPEPITRKEQYLYKICISGGSGGGSQGPKGIKGNKGDKGDTGADGTTFTPSVSNAGVISWTNDGNKTNPASVDLVAAVISALPSASGRSF